MECFNYVFNPFCLYTLTVSGEMTFEGIYKILSAMITEFLDTL